MITKWWKNMVKSFLQCAFISTTYGYDLPVKATNGTTYYCIGSFPTMQWNSPLTLNAQNAGVSFGTSDTPATDEDYILGNTITSGIAGTFTCTKAMDGTNPVVTLNCVLSNSTASDIVVKEVGIKCTGYYAATVGGTSNSSRVVLIDRTVLDTPLTVPARGNAALYYTLKTDYTF